MRETHTESVFNTAHSASALPQANARHGGTTATAQGCDTACSWVSLAKGQAAALALAKAADEVVLVLGFGHAQAREGKDPDDTTLPGPSRAQSRAHSACWSVRRALLMPHVNPGSRYRCDTRT